MKPSTVGIWAFQFFLVAALLDSIAGLLKPAYPRLLDLVYLGFAALLAGYIWLTMTGPHIDTARGVMIQAVGQKVIVYAEILCTAIQS